MASEGECVHVLGIGEGEGEKKWVKCCMVTVHSYIVPSECRAYSREGMLWTV